MSWPKHLSSLAVSSQPGLEAYKSLCAVRRLKGNFSQNLHQPLSPFSHRQMEDCCPDPAFTGPEPIHRGSLNILNQTSWWLLHAHFDLNTLPSSLPNSRQCPRTPPTLSPLLPPLKTPRQTGHCLVPPLSYQQSFTFCPVHLCRCPFLGIPL